MQYLTTQILKEALLHVCDLVIASEPMLTELDNIVGDGDHGDGMYDGEDDIVGASIGAFGAITLFTGCGQLISEKNAVTAAHMSIITVSLIIFISSALFYFKYMA